MGLFDSPDQVRANEAAQRAALSQTADPTGGAFFNLGHALGNAGVRGASTLTNEGGAPTDTRSHAEIKAALLQESLKGLDFSSRESIFAKANQLKDEGNFAEATQVLSLLPAKGADQYGPEEERERSVTVNGAETKQKYTVQQNLATGKWEETGNVQGKGFAPVSEGVGRSNETLTDFTPPKIAISDAQGELINETWLDAFNTKNGLSGEDAVDQKTMIGKAELWAGRIQKEEYDAYREKAYVASLNPDGTLNNARMNDLMRLKPYTPPQDYVQQALNLMKESGEMSYDTQENLLGLTNDTGDVDTSRDTTIEEARKAKALAEYDAREQAKDKELRDNFVRGALEDNEFSLKGVSMEEGAIGFQNFGKKTPEQILEVFDQMGLNVSTGDARQTHIDNMNWMKQEAPYTTAWLGANTEYARKSMHRAYVDKLSKEGRMEEFYRVGRVNDYLSRMKDAEVSFKPSDVANPVKTNTPSAVWNLFNFLFNE